MRFLRLSLALLVALVAAQNATEPAPPSSEAAPGSSAPEVAPTATVTASGNGTDATPTPSATDSAGVSVTSAPVPASASSVPPPGPPPLEQSSIWSYPQQPIPGRTVTSNPAATTVAESSPPFFSRTRRYNFELGYSAGRPSGYLRRMTVINNQFPGPLIEGWQGDVIEVTVTNNLDYPQSIHWHGIVQNYTGNGFGGMNDGIPGVTQCPIQPGKSFTYKFKLDKEVGTFWYHSHYGNTMADGVWGALVVHSRDDPLKKSGWLSPGDYDDDRVLFLGDFYHDQSDFIVERLHNYAEGYRGSNIVKMGDAILVNGVGQENCAIAQPGSDCKLNQPSEVRARIGSKLRLRLINHGSRTQLRFSIDNHVLKLVEVDDLPIKPVYLYEVDIDPGQRYTVIVHLNQGGFFSSFWMRAISASKCIFGGYKQEGLSVLRYTDFLGFAWSTRLPTTAPWPAPLLKDPLNTECSDLAVQQKLEPLNPVPPPPNTFATFRFDSSLGSFVDHKGNDYTGFGFNPYQNGRDGTGPVAFMNYINEPLLRQIENGLTLNSSRVAALTLDQLGAADIILNNRDIGLSHPYHLHGRPFYIMAMGEGPMSVEQLASAQLNTVNPIRRDTITLAGNSHAVLRLITDTPGVWAIHCHIGWHLSEGKLGVVVVRPDVVRTFEKPAAWEGLCAGLDINEVGPGRRRGLPPQARNAGEFYGLDGRYVNPEGSHPHQRDSGPVTPPRKRFDSPNGENVPYFSQDRTTYTLIDKGQTITESATISQTVTRLGAGGLNRPAGPNGIGPGGVPVTLSTSVDTAAASAAYATLTNAPPEAVWSGNGFVAPTVMASDGVNPLAAYSIEGVPGATAPPGASVPAASQTPGASPAAAASQTVASGPAEVSQPGASGPADASQPGASNPAATETGAPNPAATSQTGGAVPSAVSAAGGP